MRFFRDRAQEHLRFLFSEEFFLYLTWFIIPYVRTIIQRDQSKNTFFFFFF